MKLVDVLSDIILNEGIADGVVTCDKCNWQWSISDGGKDPYLCHKCGNDNTPINEDLRDWFKEKWVNIGKKVDGKHPPCGTSGKKKGYAKCVPAAKAAKMSKKEKESATNRKRKAQNDANRGGKDSAGQGKAPINVSTKTKNESLNKEKVYIDYLNKEKGFKQDRIKFTSYEAAVKWGKENFDKFNIDMIKYESIKEDWSQKYKKSINCNNPKGFSQKAHCAGKKKTKNMNEEKNLEEKLNLFLERNCPNDPGKWSASKALAKSKFDVYPSAYGNAFAAKNYKGKGGTWKKCNEGEMNALCEDCWDGYKQVGGKMKNGKQVPNCVPINEEEISPKNEREMIEGIAEIVRGIKDIDNRKESAKKQIKQLKAEGIKFDVKEFLSLCGFKNKQEEIDEYDVETIQEIQDFKQFIREYATLLTEGNCNCITEAEYRGRKVQLGKPFLTPDGPKKRSVYVKNPAGRVVKVNFGDPNMKIKKNIPSNRKSFRARHHCDTNPGPRTGARYWSCKAW